MKMKKWLSVALACSAVVLGACGGQGQTQTPAASAASTPSTPTAEGKVYRVGMNAEFAQFE